MVLYIVKAFAAAIVNMVIFAVGVLLFRGVQFPPGNFSYFLTVMATTSVINALTTPFARYVRIPQLFFLPLVIVTGLNFAMLSYFQSSSEGSLLIQSTGWLIAFSAYLGILTGLLGRAAYAFRLPTGS